MVLSMAYLQKRIPKHRITLGSAIINSGMAFGLSIGYYSISSISVGEMGMSWRAPFYILSVPIIIIGLLMLWIIKDKPKAQPATEAGAPKQKVKLTFKDLFGNRNINLAYAHYLLFNLWFLCISHLVTVLLRN